MLKPYVSVTSSTKRRRPCLQHLRGPAAVAVAVLEQKSSTGAAGPRGCPPAAGNGTRGRGHGQDDREEGHTRI